jgi:hypothetical protein
VELAEDLPPGAEVMVAGVRSIARVKPNLVHLLVD